MQERVMLPLVMLVVVVHMLGAGSGDYKTDVERIDYSNDTATASVRGPQVFGLYSRAATGNVSFGYFAGGVGIPPGERSSVDRIDYSNDSATSVAKGPLNTARMLVSATGNQDFGYVGGGSLQQTNAPKSTVDRIDYSNDTATASPKGPLSVVRRETGATGNASFGYFGGGYNAVPGSNNWLSTIDRIDYSNDTATASPKRTIKFELEDLGVQQVIVLLVILVVVKEIIMKIYQH